MAGLGEEGLDAYDSLGLGGFGGGGVGGVVFFDVEGADAGDGEVFFPVDGDFMVVSVAAVFFNVGGAGFGAVSEGLDPYCSFGAVVGVGFFGFEDAVCYAVRVFESVDAPEVCNGFVFPVGAFAFHVAAIDVFMGADLLIHGDCEERGEGEVDCAEVGGVDSVEVFGGAVKAVALILRWVHVHVFALHMVGDDDVDHAGFFEVEVIAEAYGFVFKNFCHALLGERCEEDGKLLVTVAVRGVEDGIKIFVNSGIVGAHVPGLA